MPSDPNVQRQLKATGGLAYRLKALRTKAGLSQDGLSQGTGISMSKISRVENGLLWPTEDEIVTWCQAVGEDALSDSLVMLLNDTKRRASTDFRTRLAGGHLEVAQSITELIAGAAEIAWFELDVIPGMLQTPDYARPIIAKALARAESAVDDADLSAHERAGQAIYLGDLAKQFTFILGPQALAWRYGIGPDQMAAQLIRIRTIIDLSNVTVGVLPEFGELPDVLPPAFAMYGDVVVVEDYTGENLVVEADPYRDGLKLLLEVARTGDDAVVAIDEAIGRLRA